MKKNKCKAGYYTTNEIIDRGAIACWGFQNQPPCKYLLDCVEEHKHLFSTRKYNKIKRNNPSK